MAPFVGLDILDDASILGVKRTWVVGTIRGLISTARGMRGIFHLKRRNPKKRINGSRPINAFFERSMEGPKHRPVPLAWSPPRAPEAPTHTTHRPQTLQVGFAAGCWRVYSSRYKFITRPIRRVRQINKAPGQEFGIFIIVGPLTSPSRTGKSTKRPIFRQQGNRISPVKRAASRPHKDDFSCPKMA